MTSAGFGFSKNLPGSIQNNGFSVDDGEDNENWRGIPSTEPADFVFDEIGTSSVNGAAPVNRCFPVAAGNLVSPPRSPALPQTEGRQAADEYAVFDNVVLGHWAPAPFIAHSLGTQSTIPFCGSCGTSGARSDDARVAWGPNSYEINDCLQTATPAHGCLTPRTWISDNDNPYRSLSSPPPPAEPARPRPRIPVNSTGPAANTPSRVNCRLCGRSFGKAKELRRHQESVHPSGNSPVFRCQCGFKQIRKDNYKRHIRLCRKIGHSVYACKCGYSCDEKEQQVSHIVSCKFGYNQRGRPRATNRFAVS